MSQSVSLFDLFRNRKYFTQRLGGLVRSLRYVRQDEEKRQDTYPSLVEEKVRLYGNNVLIKYQDRSITYSAFNQAANQVAHYLAGQGVGKGSVVALFMANRPEFLIYKLAITKLGAAASLINNSQKGQVLAHSLNLVKVDSVVVGDECVEPLEAIRSTLDIEPVIYRVPDADCLADPGIDDGPYINIALACREFPTTNLPADQGPKPRDTAWYIYTSGTTGLPKASVQSHERMAKVFMGMGLFMNPLSQRDVMYSTLPLYHATALASSWFACLCNGAAFALSRNFSASNFWLDVRKHKATGFAYVGELCRYLLNKPELPDDAANPLRFMIGNGMRPEVWGAFKKRFAIEEVRELYGASEGNLTSVNLFNLDNSVGMIFTPHALVKVDQETEEPIRNAKGRLIKAKTGEPGLLLGEITSDIPFEGYSDKAKNESKIIRNAFKDGDQYFNTGDILKNIGYGNLQFCDRTGDTFRWKGENVSTGELENIANQHPDVEESVAFGVEIPNTNGKAGMIAVKLQESVENFCGKGLYEFLDENMPAYAVPVFVRIKGQFAKTPTFKYVKTDLKREGFDINSCSNPIYVALPGEREYQPLTQEIYTNVTDGVYRF
ncbi:long-chain-acyl-CoA synthetase [Maricurvus nonylphenolicus]|uniref:long-chain-acyl-CoA synthetase n=1 Tax=Maricurvus nonylphenolicus TaxID=1008307 RepID=UPI0036F1C426